VLWFDMPEDMSMDFFSQASHMPRGFAGIGAEHIQQTILAYSIKEDWLIMLWG
jgi:hypothetical protein